MHIAEIIAQSDAPLSVTHTVSASCVGCRSYGVSRVMSGGCMEEVLKREGGKEQVEMQCEPSNVTYELSGE